VSANRLVVVVGFLVLCCLVYSQSKPKIVAEETIPAGYQLLPAQVTVTVKGGNQWDEHRVFLLDSTSGRVWQLLPEALDSAGKFHDASFQSVAVAMNP
jgi:hypothetical protein